MQCPLCKRWYDFVVGEEYPDQGYGCCISVKPDGVSVRGSYGSVALDGEQAKVAVPGTYAPGVRMCDFCYLQAIKRGDIVPEYDHGFLGELPEALCAENICVLYYAPGNYLSLLCSFEERWVFYGSYDTRWYSSGSNFICIGFPEQSDAEQRSEEEILAHPEVEAHSDIMAHPGVVALRAHIQSLLEAGAE